MSQNRTTRQIYGSEARTASPTPSQLINKFNTGVQVIIEVTAIAATPSVVFNIQGKNQVTGNWYTLLASAAVTGVGTTVLRLERGSTDAANAVEGGQLPRVWRVQAVHGDADSITYSVGANLLI